MVRHNRVTLLQQLSLAEFSSGKVRPKVYEKGHKKVLGIQINLEWKVKYGTILVSKVIFFTSKIRRRLKKFYIEVYKNKRSTFIINIF